VLPYVKEMGVLFIDAYYEAKNCKRTAINILRALKRHSKHVSINIKTITNIITLFLIRNIKSEHDDQCDRCDELLIKTTNTKIFKFKLL